MNRLHFLVISSDQPFQDRLTKALGNDFSFTCVCEGEGVRHALLERRPDALLINPRERIPADEDPLRIARGIYPGIPAALITATDTSACFQLLRTYGLGSALPPNLGLPPYLLRYFLKHMARPSSLLELDAFLDRSVTLTSANVTASGERIALFEQIRHDFAACPYVNIHDLQLVFEELLNNALFHAFRNERNQPKYVGGKEQVIDVEDKICLHWAAGEQFSVFSITDNQGLLERATVWDRFIRQTSLSGLLDTNGRGVYLTHLLSNLMLASVRPGKCTRIAVFFYPGSMRQPKPISVQMALEE
ncbi:TPA: hypothetical protein DDW35_03495 [Candidatus Sumerlaeota bacterium]|jgi:hypothetical protein|nr:hypothetical protein [Candidatus Sumerlaeota bacterium]